MRLIFSCHHSCTPNQDKYISNVHNMIYKTPNKDIEVLSLDIGIKSSFACGVYSSCRNGQFFKQLDATRNMMGFLNFFGTGGIYQENPTDPSDASTHIANNYFIREDNDQGAFEAGVVSCDHRFKETDVTDDFGYPIMSPDPCSCSSCAESCEIINWNTIIKKPGILTGFNLNTLFLVALLVLIVIIARLWAFYRKIQKRNRSASIDSYDRIKNIIENNDESLIT